MTTLRIGTLRVRVTPQALNATHNITSGWATFGQPIPQGYVPAGSEIKVGSLSTQTDIKTTWPDGSAKFAIVTCNPTTTDNYQLSSVPASSSTFTPTIPTASVVFTIGGVAWTATLPGSVSGDLWLNGANVKEWRSVVTPINPSTTPHDLLRVIFDVRVYSDEQARVDVTVENSLDIVAGDSVAYDVAVTVNSVEVYTKSAVTHNYFARWRKTFGVGLSESAVIFDFSPAYQAKAIPRFLSTVTNSVDSPVGATFDIMGRGGLPYDDMGATGGRPEIGPLPDWTARYLAHQDATQRSYVLANADLAGSWPIHVKNSSGNRITIDDDPLYFFYPANNGYNTGPVGDWTGRGPLAPDLAHQPSFAYVPYLITGDRYYADEMTAWADYCLLATWTSDSYPTRNGSEGLFRAEQVRGFAWSLRNVGDAAAYLPDSHAAKAYFADKVANNLAWLDTNATANAGPLGVAWLSVRDAGALRSVALWEHDFLAWAIDHVNDHGFTGGEVSRDQIVQFQLDVFTIPGATGDFAGAYTFAIADLVGDVPTYYTTLEQVFANSTDVPPFTYYGRNIRLMLIIALREGLTGAQAAYDYLMPEITSVLASDAGWSIAKAGE